MSGKTIEQHYLIPFNTALSPNDFCFIPLFPSKKIYLTIPCCRDSLKPFSLRRPNPTNRQKKISNDAKHLFQTDNLCSKEIAVRNCITNSSGNGTYMRANVRKLFFNLSYPPR